GMVTGQATLLLEDLIVALRAFGPDGAQTDLVSVSIDPTSEGLQRLQQYLARVGHNVHPGQTKPLVEGMREALGMQTITIIGVSPRTHLAQVLVEADYRMKLIGIGLERPPVNIPSYVELVRPGALA